ncbi:insulinase family protein, partial [bacterium]|nr:insulinase family protein [bacterium]
MLIMILRSFLRRGWTALLFLGLISLIVLKVDAQALKIDLNSEKYTLPNGLTVILHQDRSIPMVSYHTWYRVGSRDESPGVTGAAHMLEHM